MTTIKFTGDLKYLSLLPTFIKSRESVGNGIDIAHCKRHMTFFYQLGNGEEITVHSWETKTMTVFDVGSNQIEEIKRP